MSFFESTPSGNLLNRFAKEIDAIDCMIPDGLKMMLGYVFKLMEVCIIVLLATPFAGVIILPLALFYAFIQVNVQSYPTYSTMFWLFSLIEFYMVLPVYLVVPWILMVCLTVYIFLAP